MFLFPAIDLKDGQCVRLKLGDMAQATVFNDDPAAQAKSFEDQGFEYLHVVDLNGAFLCGQRAARRMIAQGRGGRIVRHHHDGLAELVHDLA